MPLEPTTRLGSYEILAPLGAGAMGEVYRARDLRLSREVAIKVLPADVASDKHRLERFEREARAVASLNHPNIVVLHSVEDVEGTRFLTMELVEGQTLDRHVTPGGLPVARVLDVGIALADALAAAHTRGVVHRDLKPANVMLTHDGRVKVLDFGLAKLLTDAASGEQTMTMQLSSEGAVMGTVPYMAPEQVRGEAVDARSDVFALGIILYELCAGRRPFAGARPADVSAAILRDTPAPLRADLPRDLERIVSRCLEKDPRARTQSAQVVGEELRTVRRAVDRGEAGTVASIAVLPFVNRSASADDEYFSDGLADELLTVLAKIKGLRVAARTSSFHFKGTSATIAEVGSALNVATVLEGSVRKAGNRVRISVQLVKVSDGYHMWSDSYDRTLDDIFAVQDDIAQSVVTELRTTLLGGDAHADVAEAAKGRSTDPEAHRLFLLARHLIDRRTREDVEKAIEYLTQAVERAPQFAHAWARLSEAYSLATGQGWYDMDEGFGHAREAADRALAAQPDLAEGYAARGWAQMVHKWDWDAAEASYKRASALAPGGVLALRGLAQLATARGRLDECIETVRRALEHDPLNAITCHNLGLSLSYAQRWSEAEAFTRKSLELSPYGFWAHADLANNLLQQGRKDDALAEALQEPSEVFRLRTLVEVYDALGRREEADAALKEMIEKCAEEGAFQIAEVFATRGEVDGAFEWLERAYAQRDGGLLDMQCSLRFRPFHDDPRWTSILARMGLD